MESWSPGRKSVRLRAEVRTWKIRSFKFCQPKNSTRATGFKNTSTLATVTNVYRWFISTTIPLSYPQKFDRGSSKKPTIRLVFGQCEKGFIPGGVRCRRGNPMLQIACHIFRFRFIRELKCMISEDHREQSRNALLSNASAEEKIPVEALNAFRM